MIRQSPSNQLHIKFGQLFGKSQRRVDLLVYREVLHADTHPLRHGAELLAEQVFPYPTHKPYRNKFDTFCKKTIVVQL